MKTGFTVDTQRGDIEPDFVEGGGSRWTPVEETVARIFACSLIRTAIGPYQPKPSNNMKKKEKKDLIVGGSINIENESKWWRWWMKFVIIIFVRSFNNVGAFSTFYRKLRRNYLDVPSWASGILEETWCSSNGNKWSCSFRQRSKCTGHRVVEFFHLFLCHRETGHLYTTRIHLRNRLLFVKSIIIKSVWIKYWHGEARHRLLRMGRNSWGQ